MDKIAGIVLAGGQSSRMGTSKALMRYHGVPLVEHMQNLLRDTGLNDIHISGEVPGYACIPDAVRHDGPARAMLDLLICFQEEYDRLLFVPVDMPLVGVASFSFLMQQKGSVYYNGFPLPACIETGGKTEAFRSVRELLESRTAKAIMLNEAVETMANINTQEEWKGIAS
jgi:molybdenum cofactor guanylyltransferase